MIFDECLLAHFVEFLEWLHLLLQLKYSIFQHLDVELILALLTSLTHQIHTNFSPILLFYLSRSLGTLTLIIFFNVFRIVMFGPLDERCRVKCWRRLNFCDILNFLKEVVQIVIKLNHLHLDLLRVHTVHPSHRWRVFLKLWWDHYCIMNINIHQSVIFNSYGALQFY